MLSLRSLSNYNKLCLIIVYFRKRTSDDDDTDEELDLEVDEERDGDGNDEAEKALKMFVKKRKDTKDKKKPGRKPRWCPKALDDFIDIVVTNESYKTKLIFTNSKNQHNGKIYEKILEELKARATNRGDIFSFSVPQLRSKFKKCVSFCKQAALTQKTATGIKRFQEDHGFGKWFKDLFEVVKTRDSCQPEQALEPSSTNSERSVTSADGLGEEEDLFVPIKNAKKKQSTKEKLDATTIEVMKLVKGAVDNDPTKEMINFMREEMEKSRQHELKLFQLMLSHRANDSYQAMPSSASNSTPFGDTCTGYYSTWNGGFGPGPSNQLRMPDGSYGPATSSPISNDIVFGTGSYQTF